MVDFKETAKEIFDICTNIAKADGRATEKIEEILKEVCFKNKEQMFMITDKTLKKEILMSMLKQSGIPLSKLDTLSMSWEKVNLEKVADYLLNNGVEITNIYAKYFLKEIKPEILLPPPKAPLLRTLWERFRSK